MELLLRRWAQAKAGNGRVVLISAEPGVGKSRLAEALAERIAAEPHTRLRYFCSPHHQDSALYPVIAQMERAAGFAHADAPAARLAKLQALLAVTAPPVEDVALIAELHSLPSADLAPPLDVTPQRKKEKTFEALLRQVEGLSRQQPVLMMFDDIHWIDPSSRELLDRVIERVADWPVLLLAMFRPEFQPPWTGQPHVTMLTLATARQARHGGDGRKRRWECGAVSRDHGGDRRAHRRRAAVRRGTDQGGTRSRRASAGGSVRRATSGVVGAGDLARLADGAAGSAGTSRQGDCANRRGDRPRVRLRAAGVRHRSAGAATARGARSADERRPVVRPRHAAGLHYIFKHALVQDAAYGTLLRGRRQRLHAASPPPSKSAFQRSCWRNPRWLAQHCTAAGLAEKAVGYWLKAGQHALAHSAMKEAVVQSRKGLEVLADLPESPWRRQQELDLQTALGSALVARLGWSAAEVGETLARVRALAEQLDRPEYLVLLIAGQYWIHVVRAEHRLALALGEQLENLGKTRNDAGEQLVGRFLQGASCLLLGEFVTARAPTGGEYRPCRSSVARASKPTVVDHYPEMLAYLALTVA